MTASSPIEKPETLWNVVLREYRKLRASSKSSAETLIPDQPWSDIRGIGNIIRHEYDSVDPLIIWNIINRDLDDCEAQSKPRWKSCGTNHRTQTRPEGDILNGRH